MKELTRIDEASSASFDEMLVSYKSDKTQKDVASKKESEARDKKEDQKDAVMKAMVLDWVKGTDFSVVNRDWSGPEMQLNHPSKYKMTMTIDRFSDFTAGDDVSKIKNAKDKSDAFKSMLYFSSNRESFKGTALSEVVRYGKYAHLDKALQDNGFKDVADAAKQTVYLETQVGKLILNIVSRDYSKEWDLNIGTKNAYEKAREQIRNATPVLAGTKIDDFAPVILAEMFKSIKGKALKIAPKKKSELESIRANYNDIFNKVFSNAYDVNNPLAWAVNIEDRTFRNISDGALIYPMNLVKGMYSSNTLSMKVNKISKKSARCDFDYKWFTDGSLEHQNTGHTEVGKMKGKQSYVQTYNGRSNSLYHSSYMKDVLEGLEKNSKFSVRNVLSTLLYFTDVLTPYLDKLK